MLKHHLVIWFWLMWATSLFGCSAVQSVWAQVPTNEKTVVAKVAAETEEQNADEFQHTQARKFIPELLIFLFVCVTLAMVLTLKARDSEKLRERGFFRNRDLSQQEEL